MNEDGFISALAREINGIKKEKPLLVGINGIDGVGKTTLVSALVQKFKACDIPVFSLSIDNFATYRQLDKGNPFPRRVDGYLWYYNKAFSFSDFFKNVVQNMRDNGQIVNATFSWHADKAVEGKTFSIPNDAIVLCDGVFLFHPHLKDVWDCKIFLEADLEQTLQRAIARDTVRDNLDEAQREQKLADYRNCYYKAQAYYLERDKPAEQADILIKYDDPENPVILRKWSG